MFTLKKFYLIFILSQISLTTTEQQEQENFSKEYHNVIRKSLSKVSNVFDSIDYDIKDGKFKMKWLHGNEPTLDFNFDVIFQNQEICHLEFVIDSFLAHVPEKIRFDVNSAQINDIIQSVQKCSEKIQQKITGPSNVNYDTELLKQEHDLINNEGGLSDESRKEIERVVLLNESNVVQQQLLKDPQGTINKMKVVNQYIDNEDVSREAKQEIKNQLLNSIKTSDSYDDSFESYEESSEQSVHTKQSSKDVDVGFTNDDSMPVYSQNEIQSSENLSNESGFSEDSNVQTNHKRITILDTVLDQLDHVDFSEESSKNSQKNSQENSQESKDIESQYLRQVNTQSNSQESINNELDQKNLSSNEDEQVLNVGMTDQKQNSECTVLDKELIKEKLKFLVLQNFIQDVKVFNENIVECSKTNGVKINALLSFNREKCYVGLDGTFEKGYKMLNDIDQESFNTPIDVNIMNCMNRFGTVLLKSS